MKNKIIHGAMLIVIILIIAVLLYIAEHAFMAGQ